MTAGLRTAIRISYNIKGYPASTVGMVAAQKSWDAELQFEA